MDTELMLDVGQANELKLAFRRHDWTNADIKRLCEGNLLGHLLPLVREYGKAAIAAIEHIIDCDAKPFEPSGLTVAPESDQLPNRVRGRFTFDPTKVKLHLSPNQQDRKRIVGTKLKKELLSSEPTLPANVLDFYLDNPHFIPEGWKGKAVFFWGTIYRDSHGLLYVRFLYFLDGQWYSDCYWLVGGWFRRPGGFARKLALRTLFLGSLDPWNLVLRSSPCTRHNIVHGDFFKYSLNFLQKNLFIHHIHIRL